MREVCVMGVDYSEEIIDLLLARGVDVPDELRSDLKRLFEDGAEHR
jgi:hypothetical protein